MCPEKCPLEKWPPEDGSNKLPLSRKIAPNVITSFENVQLQELVINRRNFCCGFVPRKDFIKDLDNKTAVQSIDIPTKLLKVSLNLIWTEFFFYQF